MHVYPVAGNDPVRVMQWTVRQEVAASG